MAGAEPDRRPIVIAGHVVGERIGVGAFGEVFRARHQLIGREVAIKVLHARYSSDADAVARFVTEARAVGRLSHPGIVEVFDFGALEDGRHYCVMELIRGRTLRDLLRERGQLALDEAIRILRDIAEAVDAAHAAGVAHRDLKPDNVFIVEPGGVKLIDFGLAKLTDEEAIAVTQTGSVLGTPLYMSPEQCRGKVVTMASDAYSFGALAYHVLTGAPPFAGDPLQLALHHLHDLPELPSRRRPELPPRVDRPLLALMAKDPARRPTSLVGAVDALAGTGATTDRWPAWIVVTIVAAATSIAALVAIVGPRRGAPASLAFDIRPITLRLDGVSHRAHLSRDGSTYRYTDRSGAWALDLDTGVVERSPGGYWIEPLRDGGQLQLEGPAIVLVDAAGGDRRALFEGDAPVLSPDRTKIAATHARWLIVYDLATGTTRRLVDETRYGMILGVAWSPDSKSVLWGSNDRAPPTQRLHLTRVSDAETTVVPFPMLAENTLIGSAAFLADGRVLYCGTDDAGTSIRARALDDLDGRREVVIAPLDRAVSVCGVETAAGDRAIVMPFFAGNNVGTIDLAAPVRQVRILGGDGEPRIVGDVHADGSRVLTYTRARPGPGAGGGIPDGDPVLEELVVGAGDEAAIPSCPGVAGIARRGETLYQVELGETRVGLRSLDCGRVEEWTLPAGAWSVPRCGETLCVAARRAAGGIEVWRLDRGNPTAALLATIADDADPAYFAPSLAIAPAERHAVALAGPRGTPQLIAIADGEVRRLPFPGEGVVTGVAWTSDPDHFVLSALGTPLDFGLWRVGLDGTAENVWWSASTQVDRIVGSPYSTVVAGDTRIMRTDYLLLDRR